MATGRFVPKGTGGKATKVGVFVKKTYNQGHQPVGGYKFVAKKTRSKNV